MGLFELIYYAGYRLKRSYDIKRQKALPCTVISIGNITVGGTGKTPAAIALAGEAFKRGLNPCILTRGYKGNIKGPCFVSKGFGPLLGAGDAGDEPVLMAEKLKGIPIIKAANRYEAGIFGIKELNPPTPFLFILDDGFQHWRLKRDMDILLINAANPFGRGRLLPVGILREPLREIKRADIIVITKSSLGDRSEPEITDLIKEIKQYNPSAPIFLAGHVPSYLSKGGTGIVGQWHSEQTYYPAQQLLNKDIYAFCGIGEPLSFKTTLESTGANIKGFKAYQDHHAFKPSDMEFIKREAQKCNSEWIITTEKDIIRMKDLCLPDNLMSLAIEFMVSGDFYEEVFRDLY